MIHFCVFQVNLVDWLKNMVGERKSEQVVDPRIPEKPSPKALKRALLVALRCVDPDAHKRPKMGHVIHMLEMDDLLVRDVRQLHHQKLTQFDSIIMIISVAPAEPFPSPAQERKLGRESSSTRSSERYHHREEGSLSKRDDRTRWQ